MKIIDLFEAIGGSAPLYHATNLESVTSILSKNQLAADTTHAMMYINPVLRGKPEGNKKLAGVSLTRSKAFAEDWADVILVLDQEKIRHNKKLIPINYFNDEPDGSYSAQDREEFEEFVVGAIAPLDKFISGIYFPARLENDYTNYKWVVKNIKPYPEEYKGWLAVVNSSKYAGKPIRNMVEKKAVNEEWIPSSKEIIINNYEKKIYEDNIILLTILESSRSVEIRLYSVDNQHDFLGWLGCMIDNDDNYLRVISTKLEPHMTGKGYGKKMYEALLKYMNSKFKGIKSSLGTRSNKEQIPSIYKSFGGYEKDGYAYIDRTLHGQVNEDVNKDKEELYAALLFWERGLSDARPTILKMLDQGKIPQEIRNSSHDIYRKIVITDAAFEKLKKNGVLKFNTKFPVSSWTESKEAAISFKPKSSSKEGTHELVIKKIAKEPNIILNVNDASKYVGYRNFHQGEHEILILNDAYYFEVKLNEVVFPEL